MPHTPVTIASIQVQIRQVIILLQYDGSVLYYSFHITDLPEKKPYQCLIPEW